MSAFQRIGWGPVQNTVHDLGTDLFVQARDARSFDRGLIVGAQVKSGPSYFREPSVVDGVVEGWWYYEPGVEHFHDWVMHGLPHLLVLHDLDIRVSYWVHITAEAVESTGRGAKIFVPAHQTIDREHLDDLMAVAASHKSTIALEGTAWTAGVEQVAPGRRLRYALLVPRLVAPHRNVGFTEAVAPEEALALLAQGRVSDVEHFATQHATVPSLAAAAEHRDWRWRFVAAFATWVTGAGADNLGRVAAAAPDPASRTAARVAMACALSDAERHDEAAALLAAEPDDSAPIDRAWVLTQLARVLAEVGSVTAAREHAAAAQRTLVGDRDDVTASALGAASAWLLFQTAAWGDKSLADLIPQIDTAVSWWRTQMLAWGLGDAIDRVFKSWADDQSVTFAAEDVANNRLYAAMLSAHLTGEQAEWRARSSMLARHTLALGLSVDGSHLTTALGELRRSGDDKSLSLAAERLWAVGPLDALAAAVVQIGPTSWTHSSAQTNLRVWQRAGDLLDEAAADLAVRRCLDILDDPTAFAERVTPTFRVPVATAEALDGVLAAASDEAHRQVRDFVTALSPVADQLLAKALGQVVSGLRRAVVADAIDAIRDAAEAQQPDRGLSNALLGAITEIDDAARARLVDRAAGGDINALAALGDVRQLDAEVARRLLEQHARLLETIIAEAEAGKYSLRSMDAGGFVVLGVAFPEQADWSLLLRFLKYHRVPGEYKRRACEILARRIAEVPVDVRDQLKSVIPRLQAGSPIAGLFGTPIGGVAVEPAVAVGALSRREEALLLASLLTGSRQERRDAVELIARGAGNSTALVTLLSDPHVEVRAAAAQALARVFAEPSAEADPLVEGAVQRTITDGGALVPLAVAQGFAEVDAPRAEAAAVADVLRSHRSAAVREAAARVTSSETAAAQNARTP
jgi:hypothetical protein